MILTPAEAARLYFQRRFEGHHAPDSEHGPCCNLIVPWARTNHTRGFNHVCLTFGIPYVQLRRELDRLQAVRTAAMYLERMRKTQQ